MAEFKQGKGSETPEHPLLKRLKETNSNMDYRIFTATLRGSAH